MKRIIKFIGIALRSLLNNKSQALLTMMGIVIGIGSVILMVSVGKGAESLILVSVQSFGNKSIFVQPGGGERGGPPSITAIDKLKYKDYLAIKNLDYIQDVTPNSIYQTVVSFGGQNERVRVIGTNENYTKSVNTNIQEGRFISEDDLTNANYVAVIGYKNADELFGDQDAVGKNIKINGKNFQVIGVMQSQGTRFFQDFDKRILIPVTTMKAALHGVDYLQAVIANVKGDVPQAMEDLRYFLRKRHALYNPDNDLNKDDFKVVSQVDAAASFEQVSSALTMFLVAVAAISLLVGGIGIMNIMLVAVSERTREIGLRKAVGANNSDIMLQFLIESAVLTFVAGILGVIGGVGISWILSLVLQRFISDWRFIITLDSIEVAFAVSVLIGLVFGIYPASSAAKLDPIECLRSE